VFGRYSAGPGFNGGLQTQKGKQARQRKIENVFILKLKGNGRGLRVTLSEGGPIPLPEQSLLEKGTNRKEAKGSRVNEETLLLINQNKGFGRRGGEVMLVTDITFGKNWNGSGPL